jgi:hypothetical protein
MLQWWWMTRYLLYSQLWTDHLWPDDSCWPDKAVYFLSSFPQVYVTGLFHIHTCMGKKWNVCFLCKVIQWPWEGTCPFFIPKHFFVFVFVPLLLEVLRFSLNSLLSSLAFNWHVYTIHKYKPPRDKLSINPIRGVLTVPGRSVAEQLGRPQQP